MRWRKHASSKPGSSSKHSTSISRIFVCWPTSFRSPPQVNLNKCPAQQFLTQKNQWGDCPAGPAVGVFQVRSWSWGSCSRDAQKGLHMSRLKIQNNSPFGLKESQWSGWKFAAVDQQSLKSISGMASKLHVCCTSLLNSFQATWDEVKRSLSRLEGLESPLERGQVSQSRFMLPCGAWNMAQLLAQLISSPRIARWGWPQIFSKWVSVTVLVLWLLLNTTNS